jgi:hypothetical protein
MTMCGAYGHLPMSSEVKIQGCFEQQGSDPIFSSWNPEPLQLSSKQRLCRPRLLRKMPGSGLAKSYARTADTFSRRWQ